MHGSSLCAATAATCLVIAAAVGQEAGNTISRNEFNFGHQLGYMYSRMDDAWFRERGVWRFETGFAALYTSHMPRVRNPYWRERTMAYIPLYFELFPSDNISLQIELTDLFVEFPYYDIGSIGGKSPRFKTKIRLLRERHYLPAIALTVGIKFSSAKPYVIWRDSCNYDESNGLAGAGTGVADYLLLFTVSKSLTAATSLHGRIGLAPLGSPVDEYGYGSRQADEIPYGVSLRHVFSPHWSARMEVSGMYNGLHAARLAHYSVARVQGSWRPAGRHTVTLNVEHGLTEESDEWVGGLFVTFEWKVRKRADGATAIPCPRKSG
ncbi:MAG: hypothetical protein JXA18_10520 [Chitinispirillaceae bacterium]|nr:hypothetical protein [Chitinispirillaceae bacterium]